MIKVIIADDEENVCQLIKNLVDWDSLGMNVIGIAHNGVEVLDMIQENDPDLIVTDIRMPGYDGLEMIRRAKDIKEDLEFIIISGYGHFEYAQHAIKYGVGDYLLKPIKKSELLSALDKVRARYMSRLEKLSEEERLKKQIESDADKLRGNLFKEVLMEKGFSNKNMTIGYINNMYHYSFKDGLFQVICIKIDCGYDDQYNNARPILEEKITQILKNMLSGYCFEISTYIYDSIVYCILNYGVELKKAIRSQIKAVFDELTQQKVAFEQFDFTIGIGEVYDDVSRLRDSFDFAVHAVWQCLILGTGRIIEDLVVSESPEIQMQLLAELNRSMGQAIEVMNFDAVVNSLNDFRNEISKKNLCGLDIVSLAEEAYKMYLTHLRNNQISIINNNELTENFHLHVWRCKTIEEIFQYLIMTISESMQSFIEQKKQEELKPIRIVKKYIHENYMKSITLEDVSGMVGFNPVYFSTLFKKICGVNFIDYLTETRINKAKELLRETNLNVADICERVGYNDLKHFTKNFQKITGLKPSEYRKLYS